MGIVYAITSGRGGTGKSVLSALAGIRLAQEGRSVLIVDLALGCRCQDQLLNYSEQIVYDIMDISELKVKSKHVILHNEEKPWPDLLPASQTRELKELDTSRIVKLILQCKEKYDYVILDCPVGWSPAAMIAGECADHIVIIETPDAFGLRGMDTMKYYYQKMRTDISIGVVLNRYQRDAVNQGWQHSLDDMLELVGIPVIGWIPENITLMRAAMSLKLGEYESADGNRILREMMARLSGAQVALEDPGQWITEETKGFFARFLRRS